MSKKPISDVEASPEPVPTGAIGWGAYVCALAGTVAIAATLVAFGYGFTGWGVLGAACAVVLLAGLMILIGRARGRPRRSRDRYAIRLRFRREALLRRGRTP